MDYEIMEQFQSDLSDLNAFNEFLSMNRIIQNINCSSRYRNLCVPKKRRGRKKKQLPLQRRRRRRFNPLMDLNDGEFQHSYRFSKEGMRRLVDMIKDDLEIESGGEENKRKNQVPVEKQIMAALRYWGRTEHPEITAQIHGVTFRTLMKISKRVAEALSYKASRYIRMPCLLAEKEKVTKGFYDLAHMPQVIGAVIHTMTRCKRLRREGVQHKNENMIHIQIVSDANLKIRDLDCHLVTPADNTKTPAETFTQSRIKERFEQNEFRGRLLLGDAVLKCSPYLYTPVSCAVSMAEQAFNSSLRLAYEPARRCLQMWQQRFGILNDEFYGSPNTVRHIIIALVLLHNMALEWEDTAIGKTNSTHLENPLVEPAKNSDEKSRAEFIKNHFQSYVY